MLENTRAGKSLRSVLSILENIEYGINISKKHEIGILDYSIQLKELQQLKVVFYFQLKECLPPHHIPIPTLASACKAMAMANKFLGSAYKIRYSVTLFGIVCHRCCIYCKLIALIG